MRFYPYHVTQFQETMPSADIAVDEQLAATHFDFDEFLLSSAHIDSFRRIDPSVCKFFIRGTCPRGTKCPLRHGRPGERRTVVVCKHWLRSLCKKGDACEFLHELNESRMPVCWFFQKYGECVNGEECPYQHIDLALQRPECPWYQRGFCHRGPLCKFKHVRRQPCYNYLSGFCPKGDACELGHMKMEVPDMDKLEMPAYQYAMRQMLQQQQGNERQYGYRGGASRLERDALSYLNQSGQGDKQYRPIHEVVCFKCGAKGHYANRCPNS